MRALRSGEQVAGIPGLTLVPGVLEGTGEDGIQPEVASASERHHRWPSRSYYFYSEVVKCQSRGTPPEAFLGTAS